ncbi:MAG TPA: DUF2309 domain-containing protein [Elusimicrobiota bacterium]|nr:DUF2309 domain-containing protein [Elusimicrobiota bacterium]
MDGAAPDARLKGVIERLAELLPAQGPIGIFIHHNTLHAFESQDFEQAVVSAGEKLSCEPFLPEEEYRREFQSGRILEQDLRWALGDELGPDAARAVFDDLTRLELRIRIARYGIPKAAGASLAWLLQETPVLRRFREDIPNDARQALRNGSSARDLWRACLAAARKTPAAPFVPPAPPARHRDLLLAAAGTDTDAWVNPVLIRLLGAFLDQGLARWSLPEASRGLYACFLHLYANSWASLCGRWAARLPDLIREERRLGLSPSASLERSLEVLGVGGEEAAGFLEATALALRGWAGMIRQLEERPDRVPARSRPAAVMEYLAVRLLLERAALSYAASRLPGFGATLSELRAHLRGLLEPPPLASDEERAWQIFHAAQLCGLTAARIGGLSAAQAAALEAELAGFDETSRRRVLQSAYDRHLRGRLCDALSARVPAPTPSPAAYQAIFCLDEREESFRRHLEETAPDCETFGAAGFFGVAMYYQGATDAHPRPLCPIAVKPRHYVGEMKIDPSAALARWRRVRRRQSGRLGQLLHRFNGTFLGGYLITTVAGPLSILPLVLRVVFPGLARRWSLALPFSKTPATRLLLDRRPEAPPIGAHYGYTKEEMAAIVGNLLRGAAIAGRLAPVVVVAGHGSTSLNNPHESAHDCGACGGGRGGPNARAFAQMANDPAVRALLAQDGLRVPEQTRFIGALRNTCDNSVEFFDLDLLPREHEKRFGRIAADFARTRRKEAHERCRRFENFPLSGGHGAALAHVEERAHDLAQPRPEYGHASNAFCVVGRRSRTRGLFLDRRAFLTSYDPTQDEDGSILESTLAAVTPVVAGISLEYYFSRVDPSGYGCATKLPHNVASLLGVMNGTQSDLRTGLPWQMVEIHEPVRLFLVVECAPERFESVLERLPTVRRLLDGRWIFAACLDPNSRALRLRGTDGYRPWTAQAPLPSVVGDSASWYRGRRDHLPIAEIIPPPEAALP